MRQLLSPPRPPPSRANSSWTVQWRRWKLQRHRWQRQLSRATLDVGDMGIGQNQRPGEPQMFSIKELLRYPILIHTHIIIRHQVIHEHHHFTYHKISLESLNVRIQWDLIYIYTHIMNMIWMGIYTEYNRIYSQLHWVSSICSCIQSM